jgi:hypothetical protein
MNGVLGCATLSAPRHEEMHSLSMGRCCLGQHLQRTVQLTASFLSPPAHLNQDPGTGTHVTADADPAPGVHAAADWCQVHTTRLLSLCSGTACVIGGQQSSQLAVGPSWCAVLWHALPCVVNSLQLVNSIV